MTKDPFERQAKHAIVQAGYSVKRIVRVLDEVGGEREVLFIGRFQGITSGGRPVWDDKEDAPYTLYWKNGEPAGVGSGW